MNQFLNVEHSAARLAGAKNDACDYYFYRIFSLSLCCIDKIIM